MCRPDSLLVTLTSTLQGELTLVNDLGEEPGSPLGLIDPILDKTGSGDVVVPLAEFVG